MTYEELKEKVEKHVEKALSQEMANPIVWNGLLSMVMYHKPSDSNQGCCDMCGDNWPCITIQALMEEFK